MRACVSWACRACFVSGRLVSGGTLAAVQVAVSRTATSRSGANEKPMLEQCHLALVRRYTLDHLTLALVSGPREDAHVRLLAPCALHFGTQRVIVARLGRAALRGSQQGTYGRSEPCDVTIPTRFATLALDKDTIETNAITAFARLAIPVDLTLDLGRAACQAALWLQMFFSYC